MINNINDIKHAFYINLEHRTDRKEYVENQLDSIGIKANRFNAIKVENGAIGCSLSHLKCLQIALENKWDHVLICEDDLTFLNAELLIQQLDKFLQKEREKEARELHNNIGHPGDKALCKAQKMET
jgi:GR25 family glycosyltransferase involved in LPS biosynthesis